MARFPLSVTLGVIFTLTIFMASPRAETLVLNNTSSAPLTNDTKTGFLDLIAGEAFRRNGIEISLIKLQAERGLKNANAGIDDGELLRFEGMEKLYPNLVPVPEKLMDMHFVAFSIDPSIKIDDWQSLKNYSVGYIKGWKIMEMNIPKEAQVIPAMDANQLFTMLRRGRVEVVLFERLMGLEIIRRQNIQDARDLSPSLAVKSMFIYLNKKHETLAPKVAASLAALKSEGVYEREYKKIEMVLGQPK